MFLPSHWNLTILVAVPRRVVVNEAGFFHTTSNRVKGQCKYSSFSFGWLARVLSLSNHSFPVLTKEVVSFTDSVISLTQNTYNSSWSWQVWISSRNPIPANSTGSLRVRLGRKTMNQRQIACSNQALALSIYVLFLLSATLRQTTLTLLERHLEVTIANTVSQASQVAYCEEQNWKLNGGSRGEKFWVCMSVCQGAIIGD